MKTCISQAVTLSTAFADDLSAYAEAGWTAMEVWLTKLETHLKDHSAEATREAISESNLTLAAGSYQGGLLLSQGEARKAHFDHFRARLDLCQQFAIPTMIVVGDFTQKPDETTLERAVVSLKQAAQWADGFGVKLALEFRAGEGFCTCLDTALALVEQCDEPNVSVCLDVFHYYKGPSKLEDIRRLGPNSLGHVHWCDVSGALREWMTDSDRIMPGDGDFDLPAIADALRAIGYDGFVSLETMNPLFRQAKPSQVAELGRMALERSLASSGQPHSAR